MTETGIQIEKGIPLPKRGRSRKYPLDQMDIGDSFIWPTAGTAHNAYGYAANHSKDGKTFVARRVNGVTRVWRTA